MNIPPVSRCWTVSIIAINGMASLGIISPMKLIFLPERGFSQPWRLFTSFCYFGEVLFGTILAVWTTIRWFRSLEENFSIPYTMFPSFVNEFNDYQLDILAKYTTRMKSWDFLHLVVLICVSIIITTSLGFYRLQFRIPMLGVVLHEVISYISCRTNPQQQVSIFGIITVQGVNIPLFTALLDWVVLADFKPHMAILLQGHFLVLWLVLTSPIAWKTYICLFLGHFWWYFHSYLYNEWYGDKNRHRYKLRNKTVKRVQQQNRIGYLGCGNKAVVTAVMLPPWYWLILYYVRGQVEPVGGRAEDLGDVNDDLVEDNDNLVQDNNNLVQDNNDLVQDNDN